MPAPSDDELAAGIAAYRSRRGSPQKTRMHVVSLQFARAAGVEPSLARWPHLALPLLFGPLSPVSFRLEGRDAPPDAPERTVADAEAFGCLPPGGATPTQHDLLDELIASLNEPLAAALRSKT